MRGPEFCGVYRLTNIVTGRVYIGSSVRVKRRMRSHRQHLTRFYHANARLQEDWFLFGAPGFVFEVIVACRRSDAVLYEQLCIDFYRSYQPGLGYNILPSAGGTAGSTHSLEARNKIRLGRTGKRHSEETKAELRRLATGRRVTDEAKRKLSLAGRGRKHSETHNMNIRLAKIGTTHSAEARQKIGASSRGRKPNAETRAKMSLARKGRKFTADHKANLSASLRQQHADGRRPKKFSEPPPNPVPME